MSIVFSVQDKDGVGNVITLSPAEIGSLPHIAGRPAQQCRATVRHRTLTN
jgi:hypothetical protein